VGIDVFKNELVAAIDKSAQEVGMSVFKSLTDDFCCKLLAWLYVFGGGQEAPVFNGRMNVDIAIAQSRMNAYGGEVPNVRLLPTLRRYVRDLEWFLDSRVGKPE